MLRGAKRSTARERLEHRRGLFLGQAREFSLESIRVRSSPDGYLVIGSLERRGRNPAWLFAVALLPAALGVGLFGLVRLARQFPAASSSPNLLVPFLLPVLALALEAGALIAFSASVLALFRVLPARPLTARASALLPLIIMLALVLGLAEALPRGTERPGAFANELVDSARQSCGTSGTVPVPLLGLTVRCDRGLRIEGPMPGVPSVKLAMQTLTFSDDLRRVQITGLDLTASRALTVRLKAGTARIAGLAPWTRSARLAPLVRCAILTGLGLGLALVAALCWRPSLSLGLPPHATRRWARWSRFALGGLPGVAAAIVVIMLDQEQSRAVAYFAALGAGVVALLVLLAARARVAKMFSSFSAF